MNNKNQKEFEMYIAKLKAWNATVLPVIETSLQLLEEKISGSNRKWQKNSEMVEKGTLELEELFDEYIMYQISVIYNTPLPKGLSEAEREVVEKLKTQITESVFGMRDKISDLLHKARRDQVRLIIKAKMPKKRKKRTFSKERKNEN